MRDTHNSRPPAIGFPSRTMAGQKRIAFVAGALALLLFHMAARGDDSTGLVPIDVTLVHDHAIGYATFQSHNQKVVNNRHGIFITYVVDSADNYMAQTWRLACSRDQGATFSTLYEATGATSAPVLETDLAGNILLAYPDFVDGNAYFQRHVPPEFRAPAKKSVMPGGAAGKYAMIRDLPRNRVYYFSHNNTLYTLSLDGTLLNRKILLKPGKNAVLQYPHLEMDQAGTLYAAWTTQKHGEYLYWDIHCMRSDDGGQTWKTLANTPLALPVTADDTGPAERISGDNEFDVHTWLSAFAAKSGKLHFAYWSNTDPPRLWYVRYDTDGGRQDLPRRAMMNSPGNNRPSLSALLVSSPERAQGPLYFVSTIEKRARIACSVSHDHGATWQDYAVSEQTFNHRLYSLGGARALTREGTIIGTVTEMTEIAETNQEPGSGLVYFFSIDTEGDHPPGL